MLVGVNEVQARQLQQLCWSSSVVSRCTDFRRNRFSELSTFQVFSWRLFVAFQSLSRGYALEKDICPMCPVSPVNKRSVKFTLRFERSGFEHRKTVPMAVRER